MAGQRSDTGYIDTWHNAYVRMLLTRWIDEDHSAFLVGRGYVPSAEVVSISEISQFILANTPVVGRGLLPPANPMCDDIEWQTIDMSQESVHAIVIAHESGLIAHSFQNVRGLEFTPDGASVTLRIDPVVGLAGL